MKRSGLSTALTALFVLFAIIGCEKQPDRLIKADGSVYSGELESIDGAEVTIEGRSIVLDYDEAWVYEKGNRGMVRGYVEYSGGSFRVVTGSGSREFDKDEISYVIWNSPGLESRLEVTVNAADGWTPTGIEVTENEIVSLRATGRVSVETGACGPQGIDYFSTSIALVPGATNGQLVMRVGEYEPVAAGSTWTGNSPGTGEIMLAVNRTDRESASGVGGAFRVTLVKAPGASSSSVLYPASN